MLTSIKHVAFGAITGAAGMYFFDPLQGAYRRGLFVGDLTHWTKTLSRSAQRASADLGNRLRGREAKRASHVDEGAVPARKLVARVRAELGRHVSHAHAVHVLAHDGVVRLWGPILTAEVEPLLAALREVQGVREVIDELTRHATPDGVSALQGQSHRRGEGSWLGRMPPSTRGLLGLAGAGAVLLLAPGLLRPGYLVPAFLSAMVVRGARTERDARERAAQAGGAAGTQSLPA